MEGWGISRNRRARETAAAISALRQQAGRREASGPQSEILSPRLSGERLFHEARAGNKAWHGALSQSAIHLPYRQPSS